MEWMELFSEYRTGIVREEEVVRGTLHPGLGPDTPGVRAVLAGWPGRSYLHAFPDRTELTLVRRLAPLPAERWWLHALLLGAALLSTTLSGAFLLGRTPVDLALATVGPLGLPYPTRAYPAEWVPGLWFSLPLVAILLGHELGHYLTARGRGMDASPPYFIPAPPWLNLVGTFGAFIRLRSVVVNRAVLLDVGAGGPLASFLLSLPAVVIGFSLSRSIPAPVGGAEAPFAVIFAEQWIWIGPSLLFSGVARWLVGGDGVILLHPLAFAGWIGWFVTALNLLPLSQLDGGHILYALLGRGQRMVGMVFLVLLFVLGNPWWGGWWGWWLWLGAILLLGRGRIGHPAVLDPGFPVTGRRRVVGWICVAIFILTFVPAPLQV